jgi:hypothetical protein
MAGLALLRRRSRLCAGTYRRRTAVPNPVLHYQRGDCDPGCGGCDCTPGTSSGRSGNCLPDFPSRDADCMCNACDCGCDFVDFRRWREKLQKRYQRWQLS